MINIKTYASKKKDGGGSGSGGGGPVTQNIINNNVANDWFEFDYDRNAVRCKYDMYSNGAITAHGAADPETEPEVDVLIIDNLNSTLTTAALSAKQGHVLYGLIQEIQTQSGGTAMNTCDWNNVQNKPSTFTPSAHTHAISDVTNLQTQLTTLSGANSSTQSGLTNHIADTSVHVTQADKNKLNNLTNEQISFIASLMSCCTISGNNIIFSKNVLSQQDVTADA